MAEFIRIPPDSTGARIAVSERHILEYDNQTINFMIGDIVDGQSSGANGTITGIETEGFAANSGRLYLAETSGTFTDNEPLEVSSVQRATVDLTNESFLGYKYQEYVLVDPSNPNQKQRIDRFGATISSFTDGSPVFGAFGVMQVGEPQVIKDYRFAYDSQDSLFYDNEVSGATVTYVANTGTILLTNPTTNGSIASRTSHYYHPYAPGVGTKIEMSCQVGDTGKADVVRRWGYFDDNNGVFFELNGTTLYAVKRSNTTGSVVDTKVAQSSWSNDRADGSGQTGFNLDVSMGNIYYIDLQWLGMGRLRYGVVLPSGEQQVLHIIENANLGNLPYMRTGSLPIRIEQENTGTSGSSSEFRWACGTVKHTSKVNIVGPRFTTSSGTTPVNVQAGDGDKPVLSIRPKLTYNSLPNHSILKLIAMSIGNLDAGGGTLLYKLWITNSTNLTGASFSSVSSTSAFEKDTSATAIANTSLAVELASFVITPGRCEFIQVPSHAEIHDAELILDADETTQKAAVITADNIGSSNSSAIASINWMELKG